MSSPTIQHLVALLLFGCLLGCTAPKRYVQTKTVVTPKQTRAQQVATPSWRSSLHASIDVGGQPYLYFHDAKGQVHYYTIDAEGQRLDVASNWRPWYKVDNTEVPFEPPPYLVVGRRLVFYYWKTNTYHYYQQSYGRLRYYPVGWAPFILQGTQKVAYQPKRRMTYREWKPHQARIQPRALWVRGPSHLLGQPNAKTQAKSLPLSQPNSRGFVTQSNKHNWAHNKWQQEQLKIMSRYYGGTSLKNATPEERRRWLETHRRQLLYYFNKYGDNTPSSPYINPEGPPSAADNGTPSVQHPQQTHPDIFIPNPYYYPYPYGAYPYPQGGYDYSQPNTPSSQSDTQSSPQSGPQSSPRNQRRSRRSRRRR